MNFNMFTEATGVISTVAEMTYIYLETRPNFKYYLRQGSTCLRHSISARNQRYKYTKQRKTFKFPSYEKMSTLLKNESALHSGHSLNQYYNVNNWQPIMLDQLPN
jgi:hypothetical protein